MNAMIAFQGGFIPDPGEYMCMCKQNKWLSWLFAQVTAKTIAQHEELMKKTETMNILIETNKMLREEKERLEQELQQIQAKVSAEFLINLSDIQCVS